MIIGNILTPTTNGGGGTAVAVVKAVYEPGETATATKGTTTLTSDTSGVYLFLLPEAGVWTFACDGNSHLVTVEANGMYTVGFGHLPYSDPTTIICDASVDAFDSTALSWGIGSSPVAFTALGSSVEDEAVLIPTKTSNSSIIATVDLGITSAPYTAYIVAKVKSATGTDTRIISSMDQPSNGYGMIMYGSTTIVIGSWNDDTDTYVPSTQWFAAALKYNGHIAGGGMVVDQSQSPPFISISKSPRSSCRYLTVARSHPTIATYAEPTDLLVRYIGVCNVFESEETMQNNLENLKQLFIGGNGQ